MKYFPRQVFFAVHSFFTRSFLSLRRLPSPAPGPGLNGLHGSARAFDLFETSIHTNAVTAIIC